MSKEWKFLNAEIIGSALAVALGLAAETIAPAVVRVNPSGDAIGRGECHPAGARIGGKFSSIER